MPERLIARVRKWAIGFAKRAGFDDADADDVAQDIVLGFAKTMWQAHEEGDYATLDRLRLVPDLKAWVIAAVNNVRNNRWKKEQMMDRRESDVRDAHVELMQRSYTGPESDSERREIQRIRERVLARMTPEDRALVELRIDEARSWDDMGDALGKPPGTVRYRFGKAIGRLKKALSDYRGWSRESELGTDEDTSS